MPSGPPPVRCVRSVVVVPDTWPVASRGGIATAALIEVDRRGDERLVCDGLHAGPHFWPDVEPSPPIWDADLDASLANPVSEDRPDEAGQAPGTPVADLPIALTEDDEA